MNEQHICPHCGAPLLSEVCQYCGTYVGEVSTQDLASEYPTVECKHAAITFFGTLFPFIFGFFPLVMTVPFFYEFLIEDQEFASIAILIPFIAIGIGGMFFFFRNIFSVLSVAIKGKKMDGTVYGYMDDTVFYNDKPGQKIKVLVSTSEGKRFILMPLSGTTKPYPINGHVTVKAYRNYATIHGKKGGGIKW